jgi:hypothetical protein
MVVSSLPFYGVSVAELVSVQDSVLSTLLWNLINDNQPDTWSTISNQDGVTWVVINNSETTNWDVIKTLN